MTDSDIKTAAQRVLEEIFPANDEVALAEVVSEDFVNHEAPAGTPPGRGSITGGPDSRHGRPVGQSVPGV